MLQLQHFLENALEEIREWKSETDNLKSNVDTHIEKLDEV